jgi:hypothetical protein
MPVANGAGPCGSRKADPFGEPLYNYRGDRRGQPAPRSREHTERREGSGMDTSSGGPSGQPETHAGEPRRRRRWPFVVGGLVALGLVGLAVFAVVLIAVATSGPTTPAVYDEEYVSGDGADKVAIVPIEGTIASADDTMGGVLPATTPEGLADALDQAERQEPTDHKGPPSAPSPRLSCMHLGLARRPARGSIHTAPFVAMCVRGTTGGTPPITTEIIERFTERIGLP